MTNDPRTLLARVDALRDDIQRLVNRLPDNPAPAGLESVWHLLTDVQRQLIVNALPKTPAPTPAPSAPKSDADVVQQLADLVALSRRMGHGWMPRRALVSALRDAIQHVYMRPSSQVVNDGMTISAIVARSTNGTGPSVADVARYMLGDPS